jgi:DNA repair protein RadC
LLLAPWFGVDDPERVAVAHLASGRTLIGLTYEGAGLEGEVELPIGSILASALRLGACGIVVAHNHPSGDPTPSRADKQATAALQKAAEGVGIRLYDHLIFGRGRTVSFAALGLL